MQLSPKLIRYNFLAHKFSQKIEEKGIGKTDLSKKMGLENESNLINILNGNKTASDKYFNRIASAMDLTQKEKNEIFFLADIEEMAYRYPDQKILSDRKMTKEEIIDFVVENFSITKEELKIRERKS